MNPLKSISFYVASNFIFSISSLASSSRISLLPPAPAKKVEKVVEEKTNEATPPVLKVIKPSIPRVRGNLPVEYTFTPRFSSFAENPILLPSQNPNQNLSGLKPGDIIEAVIEESLFAYIDSKAPVRAVVKKGPLKGSIFVGESSLEKNSNRIVISFNQFRKANNDEVYNISASGLDQDGVLGIQGKVYSNEALYFGGELLSAGAAGFMDATVDRSQNLLGNFVESPSLANATKKAVASALMKSTDRFSQSLEHHSEYSVLQGPIVIKVIVID